MWRPFLCVVFTACSVSPVVDIPAEIPSVDPILDEPFFAAFEPAEAGVVEVVDWWERRPLSGTSILIRRGDADVAELITDAEGRAEIPRLGPTTFDMHLSHAEFITRSLLGISRGRYTIVLSPAATNRVGRSGELRLVRGEATLPQFGDVDAIFQVRALSFAGAAAFTKRVEPGAAKLDFKFRVFRQSLAVTYATASLATSEDPPADVVDSTWASTFAWGLPISPTERTEAVGFEMVAVRQAAASLRYSDAIFADHHGWNALAFVRLNDSQTSFPGAVVPLSIDRRNIALPLPQVAGIRRGIEIRAGVALVSPDQTASAFRFARARDESTFEAEPFNRARGLFRGSDGGWRLGPRDPAANLTHVRVATDFIWEVLIFDERSELQFPSGALRTPYPNEAFGRVTDYQFDGIFPGAWSGDEPPLLMGFTTQPED